MPFVSVLMPSYNHEEYLPEVITSVLNQTFKELELIIIDDCSKDKSKTIIESYQEKDKRIKAFFHERNLGLASTMNDLLSQASGKYIAFIDSDDVWDRLKLEKQLEILEKNHSAVVWSEGELINEHSAPIGKTFTELNLASKKKKSGGIFEELLCSNFILKSSVIYRRNLVECIRFNEKLRYLNDYQFFVTLANKLEFYFISDSLTKYRINGKNCMSIDKKAANKDRVILYRYFLEEYENEISRKTKAILNFYIFTNYFLLNERKLAYSFLVEALKNYWAFYQLIFLLTNTRERFKLLSGFHLVV